MNSNHLTTNDAETLKQLEKLIDKILTDPLLLRKLSDRVCQLIREEAWLQRDRDKTNYWSGSHNDVY